MRDSPCVDTGNPWPATWPVVLARNGNASATVSLEGGQVLSWIHEGRERLYVSPRSTFAAGAAIRGGIPVIFPQFGARGSGLRHGFARLRRWVEPPAGQREAGVVLSLADDDALRAAWPHCFTATICVNVAADTLEIGLAVENRGQTPLEFTGALHTYLRVSDAANVRLWGLEGLPFADSARGGVSRTQPHAALTFDGEVDRIYRQAPALLTLDDAGDRLAIGQAGFPDTVVWNPGAALAATLTDLGEGNHRHFVCVEAACVETPVQLLPGEHWKGFQTLQVLTPTSAALG